MWLNKHAWNTIWIERVLLSYSPAVKFWQVEEKLGGKLSDEDKEKIEEVVNEKIAWLEENAEADAGDPNDFAR